MYSVLRALSGCLSKAREEYLRLQESGNTKTVHPGRTAVQAEARKAEDEKGAKHRTCEPSNDEHADANERQRELVQVRGNPKAEELQLWQRGPTREHSRPCAARNMARRTATVNSTQPESENTTAASPAKQEGKEGKKEERRKRLLFPSSLCCCGEDFANLWPTVATVHIF